MYNMFQVPLVWIDSRYYGGLVITPLNIVLYNVFSEHGPDIYGKATPVLRPTEWGVHLSTTCTSPLYQYTSVPVHYTVVPVI